MCTAQCFTRAMFWTMLHATVVALCQLLHLVRSSSVYISLDICPMQIAQTGASSRRHHCQHHVYVFVLTKLHSVMDSQQCPLNYGPIVFVYAYTELLLYSVNFNMS